MTVKFTNNASATLATSINTSVTSISVTAGQGAQFPSLTSGEFFYATLVDSSNNLEIVKVTARSSDTLTVVRGQDSTTPRAYIAGDKIELRVVSAALNAMISDAATYSDTINTNLTNHLNDTSDAHDASAISFATTSNLSSTNVQNAIAELDTDIRALSITAGTGISSSGTIGSGVTIGNTGVVSIAGSNGITLSASSGSVTVSPTAGYNGHGVRTVSTDAPSGGNDGDIWYQY